MTFQTFLTPWIKGYDLGVGVDMPSGTRMARVVEPIGDGVDKAGGAIGTFRITRIADSRGLQKALGIDVEASYGAGAFGAGVSARISFAQDQEINEQSLFLCVILSIELGFISIDDPKLTAAAAAASNDAGLFQGRYGDMFVSGLASGGLFAAVMTFRTRDAKESQAISTKLEGSYGLFSASAEVRLKEVQTSFHSDLDITVYHEGGPADLVYTEHLEDPRQMLELARRFAESFEQRPEAVAVPYSVAISPIQIAEGPPPPNAAEVQHAADVLMLCSKRRDVLMDTISTLSYVQDHPERYDPAGASPEAVSAALAGAQSDLDLVADCAGAALRNKAAAMTPEEYARSKGVDYPAYLPPQPPPIPLAIADGTTVPDFKTCTSWGMCEGLAKGAQLTLRQTTGGAESATFNIADVVPPVGTPVALGATVTITVSPPLTTPPKDGKSIADRIAEQTKSSTVLDGGGAAKGVFSKLLKPK